MSTTFGVHIEGKDDLIPIARRVGAGPLGLTFSWIHDWAPYLSNDLEVIALDNGQQGIYTLGQIKDHILKQKIHDLESRIQYLDETRDILWEYVPEKDVVALAERFLEMNK
jgi:hypothetical protein